MIFWVMSDFVCLEDERYPTLLKKTKNPPKKLFYRGEWDDSIFANCLSVVGSRRCSSYGKMATKRFVQAAAGVGITTVSGFMYGIDAYAHQFCVFSGGQKGI